MCSPRAWSQILLPVFLSLCLIQLLINFSENGFSQFLRHSGKQRPKNADKDECAEKKKCNSCIEKRGCFWCSEENTCKTFCFRSQCHLSSLFWLNCRVDMFGILMLLLVAVLIIALICYCCIFACYIQEIETYVARRPETHYWNPRVYNG
ncbi:uncharacterized protein PTTG1IP2 [Choloepus didactylus]|uniref:uncharacterized protein PTTG1IP2 n=1 Tax=Choloepus didactylus TaxID=27675 RepID=UPI00189F2945|nr:uncharacterized protein PTTG1IP2 [Choloepus didactylus]